MKLRWVLFALHTVLLLSYVKSEDEKTEEKTEEKDPWDKSTDKYVNRKGGNGGDDENLKVDVTEESEAEVHTERSKVAKDSGERQDGDEHLDSESKQQFEDAVDETVCLDYRF